MSKQSIDSSIAETIIKLQSGVIVGKYRIVVRGDNLQADIRWMPNYVVVTFGGAVIEVNPINTVLDWVASGELKSLRFKADGSIDAVVAVRGFGIKKEITVEL